MTLTEIVARIKNPALQEVCRSMYHGPHSPLGFWPASLSKHHAYAGGLWEHTLEVASIALSLVDSGHVKCRCLDTVIVACLWHDTAKIEEYKMIPLLEVPRGRRSLHAVGNMVWIKEPSVKDGDHPHIQRSADCFYYASRGVNTQLDILEHIHDCILSHHGRVEWGSPFEPKTIEAELVHYADMLSARMGMRK